MKDSSKDGGIYNQSFRSNLPQTRGVRKSGRLWKFDVTGGRYEETEFDATGSGGLFARESLKQSWDSVQSRSESIVSCVRALTAAADEDRATGGVDLRRGIFPIVMCASEAGIDEVSEAEIESAYDEVLNGRSGRNGAGSSEGGTKS